MIVPFPSVRCPTEPCPIWPLSHECGDLLRCAECTAHCTVLHRKCCNLSHVGLANGPRHARRLHENKMRGLLTCRRHEKQASHNQNPGKCRKVRDAQIGLAMNQAVIGRCMRTRRNPQQASRGAATWAVWHRAVISLATLRARSGVFHPEL